MVKWMVEKYRADNIVIESYEFTMLELEVAKDKFDGLPRAETEVVRMIEIGPLHPPRILMTRPYQRQQ